MRAFLCIILFTFNISFYPDTSFSCFFSCSSDGVVDLEPEPYERFIYHPQTGEFEGPLWDSIDTVQAHLEPCLEFMLSEAQKQRDTEQQAGVDCADIDQEIQALEQLLERITPMKAILVDMFTLITLNPNFFEIRSFECGEAGISQNFTVMAPNFDDLFRKARLKGDEENIARLKTDISDLLKDLRQFTENYYDFAQIESQDETDVSLKVALLLTFGFCYKLSKEVLNFQQEIRDRRLEEVGFF